MPDNELLTRKLDEFEAEYIDFLIDICKIESPTDYKKGVDDVGRYIIEKAEKRGWKIEIQHQEVSGDAVCITMNPDSKERPVCFSAHMDTVHPLGLFKEPIVRCDEENIYGPGTLDCKGGIVSSFMAMAALEDIGFNKRPVKLILQSDEENGSRFSNKTTVEFMAEKSKNAIAFLNCEGHTPGCYISERKGIRKYKFEITGRAVHSSVCYEGVSAVAEAAHKILELEKMKDGEGLTCNCGIINGGTAENTVPEKCTFTADVRFRTAKQAEDAHKRVNEIANKSYIEGTSCKLSLASYRCAMEKTDFNEELGKKMNEIFANNGMPELKPSLGNGGSDAADMTEYGIPTVDNMGPSGDGGHSIREYIKKDSLKHSAKMLATIAYEI